MRKESWPQGATGEMETDCRQGAMKILLLDPMGTRE